MKQKCLVVKLRLYKSKGSSVKNLFLRIASSDNFVNLISHPPSMIQFPRVISGHFDPKDLKFSVQI